MKNIVIKLFTVLFYKQERRLPTVQISVLKP
jgi:hypothetical protein